MATTAAFPTEQEEHEEPARRPMTADEFLLMPKGVNKQELVSGEVIELSPVGLPHGFEQARLTSLLFPFVLERKLGLVATEVGFRFTRNPDTVRAPDVSFISAEQLRKRPKRRGFYDGFPDLAVEVISPNDTTKEVEDKVETYLKAGTRLIWLVFPERRGVMVRYPDGRGRTLGRDDVLSGEDVIPGFEVRIADLFEDESDEGDEGDEGEEVR